MTKVEQALARTDEAAARLRAVATRLVTEHGGTLPQLLAVRLEASTNRTFVGLQAHTEAESRQWAQALGVTLETSDSTPDEHGFYRHFSAEFSVDDVMVRISSAEWFPAARAAEAVSA
ncbi:hypothetical protein [Streptomyces alfalfae]|nr:hypothetical protein [Streptomyces alfalfae]